MTALVSRADRPRWWVGGTAMPAARRTGMAAREIAGMESRALRKRMAVYRPPVMLALRRRLPSAGFAVTLVVASVMVVVVVQVGRSHTAR